MQPREIQNSSVLDILFENRNKAYGAYVLRKEYSSRLFIGLVFTVGLSCMLAIMLRTAPVTEGIKYLKGTVADITPLSKINLNTSPPPPPPRALQVAPKAATITDVTPIIVDDALANVEVPTTEEKDAALSSDHTSEGDSSVGAEPPSPGISDPGNEVQNVTPQVNENLTYKASDVEEPAEFPGGKQGLSRFLQRNLVSPTMGDNKKVQVMIKFVVGKNGEVTDLVLIKEGGEIFDREVMRVVRKCLNGNLQSNAETMCLCILFFQSVLFRKANKFCTYLWIFITTASTSKMISCD
jgi:protein TonB